MAFGRYVTVDDGGRYVTFHELNVGIKIKLCVSRVELSHNNFLHRELSPPLPHIVLRLKQVNFAVTRFKKSFCFFLVLLVTRPRPPLGQVLVGTLNQQPVMFIHQKLLKHQYTIVCEIYLLLVFSKVSISKQKNVSERASITSLIGK